MIAASAIGLVVAIGLLVVFARRDAERSAIPAGIVIFTYEGGKHDDAFTAWTESPPAGGTHWSRWQTCGFYDGQIGSGYAVHSMEHGAVWITFRRDLSAEGIARLRQIAAENPYVLVSEYPDQVAPLVVTGWNRQLALETADDPQLDAFVTAYASNPDNPAPEHGATCDGGTTEIVGS